MMVMSERMIRGVDGTTARFYEIAAEPAGGEPAPAVLLLPGGGYLGTADNEADPVAHRFASLGFHTFILRYSCRPSTYPVSLLEAAEAMRTIREHAAEWRVDPHRVIVAGFSAGGHLAANLATTAGDDIERAHGFDPDAVRPDGMMLAYPVLTAAGDGIHHSLDHLFGDRAGESGLKESVSIERHIDASTPPIFLWQTMTDEVVPVSDALVLLAACERTGASIEAHLFPTGGHGLSLGTKDTIWRGEPVPRVQCWPELFADWMRCTFA